MPSSDTETPPTPVPQDATGSDCPQSPQIPQTVGVKRRRTKKEMEAYCAELAIKKQAKQAEKERAKAEKEKMKLLKKKSARTQSRGTRSQSTGTGRSQSSTTSDPNGAFTLEDYELICSYLEEPDNYRRLYGSGDQTEVGPQALSKTAAYDIFAIYMNNNCNKRYTLTGTQLRHRLDRYRKKFAQAKQFSEHTGAGIEEVSGRKTLEEVLEEKCPCYERMDAIFGSKPNVTPCMQYDSVHGTNLYADTPPSSPEIFYSGWSQTPPAGDKISLNNLERDLPSVADLNGISQSQSSSNDSNHNGSTRNIDNLFDFGEDRVEDCIDDAINVDLTAENERPSRQTSEDNEVENGSALGHSPMPSDSSASQAASNRKRGHRGSSRHPNIRSPSNKPAASNRPSQSNAQKSSLAGAFEKTTDTKLAQFERQVDQQLAWEKEKYRLKSQEDQINFQRSIQQEEAREDRIARREGVRWERKVSLDDRRHFREVKRDNDRLEWEKEKFNYERQDRSQRLGLIQQMMAEGKSTDEIERIMRLI
ncbi:uncharacterized protein PGTG_09101 [Puccinia graminis f. sp. tritici CRL 75-36-700-3]|uniref:Uncharacterized protein n=1 Tax=Puccinia graminis f. sp. tritici (strain CRL 75-36-700-3 / race SCCL) TaxID=418459 RepID=E3KG34_PUCGT|nr:uncharacterized protein PGTG_09101 [Puccinia graminis f. sp. tritici CRL 75-36-700-3]EFP83148.2 hypothetical protein PGTG_09101 [Puccinia graminis f. sp. tritici CRL 75-36-700-3]